MSERERKQIVCVCMDVRNKQEIATVHIGMCVGVSLTCRCTFMCVCERERPPVLAILV